MENKYRHYTMRLTTLAPVFIGDGKKLRKKEYILKDTGKEIIVMIPDIKKLYQFLRRNKKEQIFSEFLKNPAQKDLRRWLEETAGIAIQPKMNLNFVQYRFEIAKNPNVGSQKNNKKQGSGSELKDIATFIKDSFGQPYIPGSSIKGMIRTALLAYELERAKEQGNREIQDRLDEIRQKMEEEMPKDMKLGTKKQEYLKKVKRQTAELETLILHTLDKKKDKPKDALNSVMKGLIIGDSKPIGTEHLMLAQKIDVATDGNERGLPIYREALKPGVEVQFEISLSQEFLYSIEDIFKALEFFNQISNRYFYQKFIDRENKDRENKEPGTVYLGGGVGFLSKTVVYPAFREEGLGLVDKLFYNTLGENYNTHKHQRDKDLGVSPHACKCTKYNGKTYNMGICKLEQLS